MNNKIFTKIIKKEKYKTRIYEIPTRLTVFKTSDL